MDEQKFIDLFTSVSEMYDKDPSPFVIDLWFNSLGEYELESVKSAFSSYIKNPDNGKFMPKPSDIVKIIDGSPGDIAYNAWSMVEKSLSTVGSYQSVVFDDPIIHRVIQDMGGWIKLCSTLTKELPFRLNEFTNRYKAFKNSGKIPEYPCKLVGLHEGDNASSGHLNHIPKPVLIGDSKKAQLVLIGGSNRSSLQITDSNNMKKIELNIGSN